MGSQNIDAHARTQASADALRYRKHTSTNTHRRKRACPALAPVAHARTHARTHACAYARPHRAHSTTRTRTFIPAHFPRFSRAGHGQGRLLGAHAERDADARPCGVGVDPPDVRLAAAGGADRRVGAGASWRAWLGYMGASRFGGGTPAPRERAARRSARARGARRDVGGPGRL
eukprot:6175391-Pleurochrysis_carterae.AAC.1